MKSEKMSKEEFLEKVSCLELSEGQAIKKLTEELHHYEKKIQDEVRNFF